MIPVLVVLAIIIIPGTWMLPRFAVWFIGWFTEDAAKVVDEHRAQQATPHRTQLSNVASTDPEPNSAPDTVRDDTFRRLLYARQALQPVLEVKDRERVDAQFLKLRDVRTEAQAQVQKMFDMGMTMEMLRAMRTISGEQIGTIEDWVASGDVVPSRT